MPKVYNLSNTVDWSSVNKKIYADTNILSPIYYDQSAAVPNQINVAKTAVYQKALREIFTAGLQLHLASVVMMEMINVFVKWDFKIYNSTHPGNKKGELKAYRVLPSEMNSRKRRYPLICNQISSTPLIRIEDTAVASGIISAYVNTMDQQALDVTDYMIAMHVKKNGGILMTDDRDYANPLTDFDLITNNQSLVQLALQNGFGLANPAA